MPHADAIYVRTNSIRLDPVASCCGPDSVGVAGLFVDAAVLLLLFVVLLCTSKSLDTVAVLRWLLLQRAVILSILRYYCLTLLLLAGLLPLLLPYLRDLLLAAVVFIPSPRHWDVRILCSVIRILRRLISEVGHGSLGNPGRKNIERFPHFVRRVLTSPFFYAIVVYACVFH